MPVLKIKKADNEKRVWTEIIITTERDQPKQQLMYITEAEAYVLYDLLRETLNVR